jgi:hypothetical protein
MSDNDFIEGLKVLKKTAKQLKLDKAAKQTGRGLKEGAKGLLRSRRKKPVKVWEE